MSLPLLDPAKDLEKQEFDLCQSARCKSVTHLNSALDGDENSKESGDSLGKEPAPAADHAWATFLGLCWACPWDELGHFWPEAFFLFLVFYEFL